ncbi:hypothetical protein L1987_04275 [Smallanthus sonchifolius]|uniref:Uncharacterized protein n=1 Tax=Smallanthus sonchifolius TaxID=185202 RepID=A0ACB9KD21_9ASTR|nr:hypothetical protein L1987_04275 [Smallanthus sonchifolius]
MLAVITKAKGADAYLWDDCRRFLCFARQNMVCMFRHDVRMEITLLSQLSHPNIVQYYGKQSELGRGNLSVFLEYCPFRELVIQNYTRKVLSGFAYLHGRSTIHRDIKGQPVELKSKSSRLSFEIPTPEPACPTVWNPSAQMSCIPDGQASDFQGSWHLSQTGNGNNGCHFRTQMEPCWILFVSETKDQKGLSTWYLRRFYYYM